MERREHMSTAKAARILGVTQQTVRDLLKRGELEGGRQGVKLWRVYVDSLETCKALRDFRRQLRRGRYGPLLHDGEGSSEEIKRLVGCF